MIVNFKTVSDYFKDNGRDEMNKKELKQFRNLVTIFLHNFDYLTPSSKKHREIKWIAEKTGEIKKSYQAKTGKKFSFHRGQLFFNYLNRKQLYSFDVIYSILKHLPVCQNHPLAKGATDCNAILLRNKINENKHIHNYGCTKIEKLVSYIKKWNVTSINLEDCFNTFTSNDYAKLKHLTSLTDIDLTGCCHGFKDKALKHFQEMSLISLNLTACDLTDAGLAFLPSTLTSLNLTRSDFLTDAGLANLGKLPSLTHLDLSESDHITSQGLSNLKNLPLKYLSLNCTLTITDGGLAHLKNVKSLTYLDLSFSDYITDFGIAQLKDLHSLTNLNVAYCPLLTNEGFKLLKHLPLAIPLNECTSEVPEMICHIISYEETPEAVLEVQRSFYKGFIDTPTTEENIQCLQACRKVNK